MTTTQTTAWYANPHGIQAEMEERIADQSTQLLCEAIVMLATLPRTSETNLTRALMLDALCNRHPEAAAAAEAWADSDDLTDLAAVVADAALTAIGA